MEIKQKKDWFFAKGNKDGKFITFIFLLLIFFIGALNIVVFLHSGDFSLSFEDWPKEREYLSILKSAVTNQVIPYYMSETIHMTDKFLGIPETILSPQIFLLKYMNVGRFVCLQALLLYILGFFGCLLLKRKFKLSNYSFLVFFLLFNLNGYIISRLGVGHLQWLSCLLLPYFVLFVLDLIEKKDRINTGVKLAFFMFFILLQGAFLLYIWCTLFLLLLLLFNCKEYLKPILLGLFLGAFLSAFRLLPAGFAYLGKSNNGSQGFFSLTQLFEGMVFMRDFNFKAFFGSLGWFEFNLYVDILGFLLLIYFGVYLTIKYGFLKKGKDSIYFTKNNFIPLYLAVFALFIFSFNKVYGIIGTLPIPLFNSQSVSARFIIIPFVFVLLFSIIRLDDLLQKIKGAGLKILFLLGALFLAGSLEQHSELYRVKRLSVLDVAGPLNDMSVRIIFKTDPLFVFIVKLAFVISATAFLGVILFLLFRFVFLHRSKNNTRDIA